MSSPLSTTSCIYCTSLNTVKRGWREKKREKVQLYLCHSCLRTFTPKQVKGKHYPHAVIIDAINYEMKEMEANKKVPREEKLSCVDPTRFALVSLRVKGRILLHKLQARVHSSMIKQKNSLLQESSFATHRETHSL